MTAPLYFLPHVTAGELAPGQRIDRRLLARRGLDAALADVEHAQRDCALNALAGRGPDGLPGVILCALPAGGEPPRRLGHYPDEQNWHPCWQWSASDDAPDYPSFFIGLDTAEPPRPSDVQRRQTYRGHRVRLADGNDWEVPVLRSPVGATSLPRTMGWDAAGNFAMQVKREYLAAWDASEDTARRFYVEGEDRWWDLEEGCLRGLQALAINYRVGRAEQSILGLIDSTNWEEVLLATIDGPAVRAYLDAQKKTAAPTPTPGSPNGSPGDGDCPPATDPAAASCSSPG